MESGNFWDLETWKKSHQLTLLVYQITNTFPGHEQFGIVSQVRRAAASIGANLAEGYERFHRDDKIRFYHIARGSAAEVQNFLFLSADLGYTQKELVHSAVAQATEIRKMINGLIRSLKQQNTV